MNFGEALAFRGINPGKPVEMEHRGDYWYGFLVKNKLLHWEFFGLMVRPLDRQVVMGEVFGSSLHPDIDDDETLWTLQRQNPFIGTTHYPDLAFSMKNISRLRMIWYACKELARMKWQLIKLMWITMTKNVVEL